MIGTKYNDTMNNEMKKFDITIRCMRYGVRIIKLANDLPKTPAGFAIANQIIPSGTSIGANVVEAQDAISRKEFVRVMSISLRECRETLYWLVLIEKTNLIQSEEVPALISEGKELRAIIATIIKNTRLNTKNNVNK